MNLLALPFRLTSNGSPALVVQGSDAHLVQQAVGFVSTRPGELPLAPSYGVEDMAFRVVEEGEIVGGMARFHPDVVVDSISIEYDTTGSVLEISAEISDAQREPIGIESEVIFGA